MSYIVYIFFSFLSGLLLYDFHINILIIPIFLLSILYHKNKLFSLALFIFFISGLISMHNIYIKNTCDIGNSIQIKRTLTYDYIVNSNHTNFLLKTDMNFFEGDIIYGRFNMEKLKNDNSYINYLHSKNVFYKITISSIDSVKSSKNILRFRTILINRNKEIYNKDTAGFINSILFGYKKDMNYFLKKGFVKAGAVHFLAISGLHTGIIFSFIMLLLFFIPINIKYKLIISNVILLFYAYITYFNPPIVRAVIFIIVINISYIIGKEIKWINFVFTLAIILLIFNPYYIYDNGFILSFASILIIVYTNKMKNINFLLKIFLISIFITLNISPFILYRFNYISLLSPISTLILMPIFMIIIPLSLIVIIFKIPFLINIIEGLYNIIQFCIHCIEKIPMYYEFHLDMFLFIFIMFYLIFIQMRKYKIAFIVSMIIFLYVI